MEVYGVLIWSGNYGLSLPAIMTLCMQVVLTLETSLNAIIILLNAVIILLV